MSKIVLFKIEKGEDGYYVGSANDYAIVTQGKTFEDLVNNIKEATDLYFEEVDQKENISHPVMINFDLADMIYA